jgi:hypothetical protein
MNRFKKYKIQQAEKTIRQAFAKNVHPGNDNLLYGRSGDPKKVEELLAIFTDKNWQDISLNSLKDRDYLSPFSKNALHYYLPTFMIITLEHYGNPKVERIVTSTLFTLKPSMRKHNLGIRPRWLKKTVEGLTQEQMEAIKLFLETIVDVYDDDWGVEALDNFWRNYKQEV